MSIDTGKRLNDLEAEAFRTGRTLADLREAVRGVAADTELIPPLANKIGGVETDVAAIRADLAEVKRQVGALDEKVGALDEKVDAAQAEMRAGFEAMDARFAALTGLIGRLLPDESGATE